MLEFAGRFSDPKLLIKTFKHWSIVYKEMPSTLGQVVFVLNKETPTFSDVTSEQMAELPEVCKWYETKLKKLYGAEKFNYCAIMMKEHFVHFNVYPRYSQPVEVCGVKFTDEGWPKKVIDTKIEIDSKIQEKIISNLKN